MTHFKIIVPIYNSALWAVGCLESIRDQNYPDWQAVIIVEPSTDNTLAIVKDYLNIYKDPRFLLIENKIRKNVPKNHIDGIHCSCPNNEDVIVLVDGDDKFYTSDALKHLDSVYSNPNIWITWGSYCFQHDHNKIGGASIPLVDPKKDLHRNERWWRYSHLKTFRYKLFKNIKDEDLREKTTGQYYTVAGDMALMFPMVEMAGPQHSQFISKILYEYNQSTIYNDEKIHYDLVKKCDWEIRSRPKYSPISEADIMKPSMKFRTMVFSKDRAAQLYALLESVQSKGITGLNLTVLYTTSNEDHERQYRTLRETFSNVTFIREIKLAQNVRNLIEDCEYICFFTDDSIVIRSFGVDEIMRLLEEQREAAGFSLRLGKNITYCYPLSKDQKQPVFVQDGHGILEFDWTKAECDWGYPAEVSSSVYRAKDILPMLPNEFRTVNALESELHNCRRKLSGQCLFCYETSVAFAAPLNVVSMPETNVNRRSNDVNLTSESMRSHFEAGYKIDISRFNQFVPIGCHQEVEINWIKR